MVTEFRHTGIAVDNIEYFKNIFVNYLGIGNFTDFNNVDTRYINSLVGSDVNKVKICIFQLDDDSKIELLEYNVGRIENTRPFMSGIAHLSLSVSDIDDLYNKRELFDVSFVHPPMYNPEGTVKLSYAQLGGQINVELVEVQHG